MAQGSGSAGSTRLPSARGAGCGDADARGGSVSDVPLQASQTCERRSCGLFLSAERGQREGASARRGLGEPAPDEEAGAPPVRAPRARMLGTEARRHEQHGSLVSLRSSAGEQRATEAASKDTFEKFCCKGKEAKTWRQLGGQMSSRACVLVKHKGALG